MIRIIEKYEELKKAEKGRSVVIYYDPSVPQQVALEDVLNSSSVEKDASQFGVNLYLYSMEGLIMTRLNKPMLPWAVAYDAGKKIGQSSEAFQIAAAAGILEEHIKEWYSGTEEPQNIRQ